MRAAERPDQPLVWAGESYPQAWLAGGATA